MERKVVDGPGSAGVHQIGIIFPDEIDETRIFSILRAEFKNIVMSHEAMVHFHGQALVSDGVAHVGGQKESQMSEVNSGQNDQEKSRQMNGLHRNRFFSFYF